MWPFDRRHAHVLRVGARALELWRAEPGALVRIAHEELPQRCSMYELGGLVGAIRSIASRAGDGGVLAVVESALMPLVLADSGGALWKPGQVEALLRHRFRLSYGGAGSDVEAWQLRTDFRFGERSVLGYGLPVPVADTVRSALLEAKTSCTAMLPALAWGIERARPAQAWPQRSGWLGWAEQDRLLLARLERGRVVALHPAAPIASSSAAVERLVDAHAARSGGNAGGPVCVLRWESGGSAPAPSARVAWRALGGRSSVHADAPIVGSQPVPTA